MPLTEIKRAIRGLSLGQLTKLDEWLHELIRRADEAGRAEEAASRKQIVTERSLENKTYRLETVRCGKEKCKCARGNLHGPYWYSYTRVKDRVTSQYVGKRLPRALGKKFRGQSEE